MPERKESLAQSVCGLLANLTSLAD